MVETRTRHMPSIRILPCQQCLGQAGGTGYAAGHQVGVFSHTVQNCTLLNVEAEAAAEAAGEAAPD